MGLKHVAARVLLDQDFDVNTLQKVVGPTWTSAYSCENVALETICTGIAKTAEGRWDVESRYSTHRMDYPELKIVSSHDTLKDAVEALDDYIAHGLPQSSLSDRFYRALLGDKTLSYDVGPTGLHNVKRLLEKQVEPIDQVKYVLGPIKRSSYGVNGYRSEGLELFRHADKWGLYISFNRSDVADTTRDLIKNYDSLAAGVAGMREEARKRDLSGNGLLGLLGNGKIKMRDLPKFEHTVKMQARTAAHNKALGLGPGSFV